MKKTEPMSLPDLSALLAAVVLLYATSVLAIICWLLWFLLRFVLSVIHIMGVERIGVLAATKEATHRARPRPLLEEERQGRLVLVLLFFLPLGALLADLSLRVRFRR